MTSISAKIGFYPPLFDGNYVTGPGEDSRVLWGAFAEAILIIANIANIGTATALTRSSSTGIPTSASASSLPDHGERLIGVGILAVLTVVTLRQDYAAADEQSAAGLAAVGDAFLVMQEWTFNLGPAFVVGVDNGCILSWMMFRSGLVPRRLAVLGLIGGRQARRRRHCRRGCRLRGGPRPDVGPHPSRSLVPDAKRRCNGTGSSARGSTCAGTHLHYARGWEIKCVHTHLI